MENSPLDNDLDVDSEKKDSKSKKKKSGVLGLFVAEPKPAKEQPGEAKKESADVVKSPEPTTNPEQIDSSEKLFIERELTKAEQADDLEPVPALDRYRQRIIEEGLDSDASLDEALAELELLPDAHEDSEAQTDTEDPEAEPQNDPVEFGEEEILLNENVAADLEEDVDYSVPSGGATPPPTPPVAPMSQFGPVPAFNLAPNQPPTPQDPDAEYRQVRANTAGAAIVGGVIGYLIGRRRGRIKTEKRLLPVQKKLKKEVIDLQSELQYKEARIRTLAAAKVQEAPKVPRPKTEKIITKVHAPEQIGHMLLGVEAARVKPESSMHPVSEKPSPSLNVQKFEQPNNIEKPKNVEKFDPQVLKVEKNIDTLNRAELMRISEKIIIDGSSLRQIYETRLVGEKGLRRLVKEHLKGGDIKKALRREIVEREIDFERDPGLRDHAPQADAAPKGGGRAATLNDLLENAELAVGEDQEEVAFLKARSAFEDQERLQQKSNRRIMDVSLVSTVLILFGLVIMLVINRS